MIARNPIAHSVLSLVVAFALLGPSPALGESRAPGSEGRVPWSLIDSLGYGAAGLGISVWAASGMDSGNTIGPSGLAAGTVLLGTVGGLISGWKIGASAKEKAAEGQLGLGHRSAAVGGTVFLGAALGALVASSHVKGEETSTKYGSDEDTVRIFSLVGAGVGALTAAWLWGDLESHGYVAAPAVFKGGEIGFQLRGGF